MSEFFDRWHDVLKAVGALFALWTGWLTNMTLIQATAIAGFVSTCLLIVYTCFLLYILIRDKIIRDRPPWKQHERAGDPQ